MKQLYIYDQFVKMIAVVGTLVAVLVALNYL